MKHHFSNSLRIRNEITNRIHYYKWHELPQELRVLILEDISRAIEEVLGENDGNR